MSREQQIQELTEALSSLTSGVVLSDDIGSDSSFIAASSKAVSSVATAVLEAARDASEGSDGESAIWEPLLGDVTHEIGSWWFSIDGSIPAGGLPHLGHLVSRSAYGTGWDWIEMNKTIVSDEEWLAYASEHNGTCPYYSYGDGSTTFRTPSYDQSFLKVLASINGVGVMEEAGLPNITGEFGVTDEDGTADLQSYAFSPNDALMKGSFYKGNATLKGFDAGGASSYKGANFCFDASRSSSIYGNSDTVTPQNYGIIVGIYLVGAVSAPIGETDAAGLLNGLSTLEGRTGALENGNGFNSIGKAEIVSWGMPDYSAGVTMSATTTKKKYTCPSDGVIVADLLGCQTGAYLAINGIVMSSHLMSENDFAITGQYLVSSGDIVQYQSEPEIESATHKLKFFPYKGSE